MYTFKPFQSIMLRDSYSILFVMRKSKRDPTKGTIYARLTYNKIVVTLCSMNIQILFSDFNTKKQSLRDQVLNNKLVSFKSDVTKLIESTPNADAYKIRDIVNGKTTNDYTIISIMKKCLNESPDIQAFNTKRDWESKILKLENYLISKKNDKMNVMNFDNVQLERYKEFLQAEGMAVSSIFKHKDKIKRAISWAVKNGHVPINPIRDYSLGLRRKKEQKKALRWELIEDLMDVEFEGKIKKAVDLFLFSCHTGICYADLIAMKDNFVSSKQDSFVITGYRQKSGARYCTPIWGYAEKIYNEFKGLEAIPKLSDQKLNDYIKLAFEKIDYPNAHLITFHQARHTFATYCKVIKGLDNQTIMTFTGHQSEKDLMHYVYIDSDTAIKAFYK